RGAPGCDRRRFRIDTVEIDHPRGRERVRQGVRIEWPVVHGRRGTPKKRDCRGETDRDSMRASGIAGRLVSAAWSSKKSSKEVHWAVLGIRPGAELPGGYVAP